MGRECSFLQQIFLGSKVASFLRSLGIIWSASIGFGGWDFSYTEGLDLSQIFPGIGKIFFWQYLSSGPCDIECLQDWSPLTSSVNSPLFELRVKLRGKVTGYLSSTCTQRVTVADLDSY